MAAVSGVVGGVKIVNLETGKCLVEVGPASCPVRVVKFSPDGKLIVTGHDTGQVQVTFLLHFLYQILCCLDFLFYSNLSQFSLFRYFPYFYFFFSIFLHCMLLLQVAPLLGISAYFRSSNYQLAVVDILFSDLGCHHWGLSLLRPPSSL